MIILCIGDTTIYNSVILYLYRLARSIQRPSSTEPSSSSQPSKPLTKPGRSKSVGAKVKTSARSRDTAVRGKYQRIESIMMMSNLNVFIFHYS